MTRDRIIVAVEGAVVLALAVVLLAEIDQFVSLMLVRSDVSAHHRALRKGRKKEVAARAGAVDATRPEAPWLLLAGASALVDLGEYDRALAAYRKLERMRAPADVKAAAATGRAVALLLRPGDREPQGGEGDA